jgi:hypothetical protein
VNILIGVHYIVIGVRIRYFYTEYINFSLQNIYDISHMLATSSAQFQPTLFMLFKQTKPSIKNNTCVQVQMIKHQAPW